MHIGEWSSRKRVLVIAEIGNNHEGSYALAEEMIGRAAECGAGGVKFQTIVPEWLVSRDQVDRLAQLERFRLSENDFIRLSEVARDQGVLFLSTPFDPESVRFLDSIVPAFKISSSDNTFFPLLRAVAETGKPILLSTGLAGLEEVTAARDCIHKTWIARGVKQNLALLHCISCYPTPLEEVNLSAIRAITSLGVVPGYSDHTLGIEAAVLASAVGARIIEKHFTLDKNYSDFRDHKLSADPEEMRELVRQVQHVEELLGREDMFVADCEKTSVSALRRSIAARRDLSAGVSLGMEDLCWVRPGKGIRPGEEEKVVGRTLRRDVRTGEVILLEDLA